VRHPLMRIEDPEERYPSPKGESLAKMLGYESVEEMQKAFDMAYEDELRRRNLCDQCGTEKCKDPEKGNKTEWQGCDSFKSHWDIEIEEEAKWVKNHPLRCETCASYVDGDDSVGLSEGCEGKHWQSMYLPGFPFPNGCKYHSKRRARGNER
jgi:hypothetical protein